MKRLLILRPEPGAGATAARASALGLDPILCPLFAIEPVAWDAPDPAAYDALLLTSANAVRHGGAGLGALAALPVLAVGEATAAAARAAGLTVTATGAAGVEALLATVEADQRLLHLTGADHTEVATAHRIDRIAVYRAAAIAEPRLPPTAGLVLLVHSPRAGQRLAELVPDRAATAVAAISEAAAAACGTGWQALDWSDQPTNSALLALAARLCQGRVR